MQRLTPKQEKFAQLYITLGNASEAYRQSYDAERMKPATINRNATALLAHSKVSARINGFRAEMAAVHEVTRESIARELGEDRDLAHEKGQLGAAVSATLGKAKLHGLMKEEQAPPSAVTFVFNLGGDKPAAVDGE